MISSQSKAAQGRDYTVLPEIVLWNLRCQFLELSSVSPICTALPLRRPSLPRGEQKSFRPHATATWPACQHPVQGTAASRGRCARNPGLSEVGTALQRGSNQQVPPLARAPCGFQVRRRLTSIYAPCL